MDGRGFGGGDDGPAGCQVQLVYYVEGDPRFSVSPDALVIKGVRQYRRRVVKLWEEGRAPQVIFEVISRSTRQEDRGRKRRLYAELGVREYYMYDPTGDYLDPRLQAWMLAEDTANGPAYREMPLLTDEPGYLSLELGLEVRLRHDSSLGLRDPASGEWLEAIAEMHAARYGVEAALHEEKTARQQAEAAASTGAQARARLEQEVARLRVRLLVCERLSRTRVEKKNSPSPGGVWALRAMSLGLVNWNVESATPRSRRTTEILSRVDRHAPEVISGCLPAPPCRRTASG